MLHTLKRKNNGEEFTWDSETGKISDPWFEEAFSYRDEEIRIDGHIRLEYPMWSGCVTYVRDPRHDPHDFKAILECNRFIEDLILPKELEEIEVQFERVDFSKDYYDALREGRRACS